MLTRHVDLVVALTLVALAAIVTAEGLRLGLGWGTDGPKSGFFVFYLGLALGLSSAIVGLQTLRSGHGALRRAFVTRGQLASVVKVCLPAVLMVLLTHRLGLYVAGALYLGIYMRWIGRHSWALTVALSVAIPVATFLVFEVWFLVPMPKGPLEAYLGY